MFKLHFHFVPLGYIFKKKAGGDRRYRISLYTGNNDRGLRITELL